MDCKDLMVGDWVSVSGKSVKITKDDLATMLIFLDDDSKIDPIPLTEEILVKNGFTKDGNGDYEINDGVVVVMDWKGKSEHFACAPYEVENCFGQYHYLYVELFECKYVHQLQRLLKLCNIDKEVVL